MKPFTARIVYCVCLSALLAACAALPDPLPLAAKDDTVTPLALSERVRVGPTAELASTMRLHAELAYSYGDAQTSIIEISAAQASLRDGAMQASNPEFKHDLIAALSDELADARRDRAVVAKRLGEQHSETVKADAVVTALMAAINAEVRHAKTLT
jgi:uncharacterized lipoprotein YajG